MPCPGSTAGTRRIVRQDRRCPTERLDYSPISSARSLPARRRAAGGVGHRQCRGMGHQRDDAAHRPDPAGGRRRRCPTSRTGRGTNTATGSGSGGCSRCSTICAVPAVLAINGSAIDRYTRDRRGGDGAQLGIHRPRLQPEEHAEGRRRARRHRARPRRRSARRHRQEPARLARPRPDRDLGDAGPPRRGGLRLCLRLGARRPAGVAEDPQPGRSSTCPTPRNATMSR